MLGIWHSASTAAGIGRDTMTQDGLPGRVLTFYSYKGGTGRTMLLANVAWILASAGRRVLAIDWDLEAPGLHQYFHPFLIDPRLQDTDGLIDIGDRLLARGRDAPGRLDWHKLA
jgi:hypothetical protein